MKRTRCNAVDWICSVTCVVLAGILLSSAAYAADARYLWQSREQFVSLERQDSTSTGPAQVNNHPAELSLDRLTAILGSISMRQADGGKPEPLLTRSAVETLAPYLQQGLQQASATEDVTFAVIGLHDALYGLAKSPKVTTGRVFYKSGQLNIIFGIIQQEVRDRDDRRLYPFTPGSRLETAEGAWTLLPLTSQSGYSQIRKDWLTFSNEWQAATVQPTAVEQRTPSVQPEKRIIDPRKPADRLSTLKELKDKGLISEEEYHGKRLDILNGL